MSCGSLNVSLVCGVCSQVDSLNVWVYTRRRRSRIVRQTFLYQVMWHHVTSLRPTADVLYRRRRRRCFFNISTCPEIKFDAVSHQSSWSLMCRFKLITWLHQSGSDRYDTPAPPAGHAGVFRTQNIILVWSQFHCLSLSFSISWSVDRSASVRPPAGRRRAAGLTEKLTKLKWRLVFLTLIWKFIFRNVNVSVIFRRETERHAG